jgi:hypothetical protein
MFKTTSKIEKTEKFYRGSLFEFLFVCNPEPKLGYFDKPFSFKCSF